MRSSKNNQIKGKVNFDEPGIAQGWCFRGENQIKAHCQINGKIEKYQIANKARPFLVEKKIHKTGLCGYRFNISKQLDNSKETEVKVSFGLNKEIVPNNFKFFNSEVEKQKLFFLHIPKAAGSSLNEMFSANYPKNSSIFHIEGDRGNAFKNIDTEQLQMFSGHIRLYEALKFFSLANYYRVTVLRDPFQHLISHINWVKHISENRFGAFFKSHPEPIREVSLKLREVNFSNISEVESFLAKMPDIGKRLFNNCQTRYLYNGKEPLEMQQQHTQSAIHTLHFFDTVGTVEQLSLFTSKVWSRMGWKSDLQEVKTNTLKNKYGLDKESQRIKEALSPLIKCDQILYDHVFQLADK